MQVFRSLFINLSCAWGLYPMLGVILKNAFINRHNFLRYGIIRKS